MRNAWDKFKKDIEKLWNDPEKMELRGREMVEEVLKPRLQEILEIILEEDRKN